MIRLFGAMLAYVLLVGSCVTLAAERPENGAASDDLIENSSFEAESQPGQSPPGWSLWTQDETGYRCEVAAGGRTGKQCLKVDGAGTRGVVFAKGVPIDRNKRYALRGWVKFEGEPGARALILFHYFHEGKWLGLPDAIGVTSRQKDWQLQTKTDRTSEVSDASMIWISCTLEGKGAAWFDDVELVAYDGDNLPADFESRLGASNQPAELNVLARRVGVWDTQTTIKPGVWVANGRAAKGVETVEWQLGKKFLYSKSKEQPGTDESLVIETYDPQAGAFRLWHFDSNGNFPRGEYAGQWDDKANTLTYEGVDSNGVDVKSVQRFVTDDRIETHAVWRDKNGGVLMEMERVVTRSK